MSADTTSRSRTATPGTAGTGAVSREVLRLQRRSLLTWGLALAIVATIYTSFYPAMSDGADLSQMIEGLPEAYVSAFGLEDIASAAGYLTSTVYGLLGPALLLVFSISAGARFIAGMEEDGHLELELTAPVSRRSVYLERWLALAANIATLVAVVTLVVVALVAVLDMEVDLGGVVAGSVGLLVFVLAHGSIAFGVGAATGRRGLGIAVAAAVAVTGYIADAIGPMIEGAGWLQDLSPWYWYLGSDPLRDGLDLLGISLLLAVTVVAVAAGLLRFQSRDLGV